MIYTPKTSRGKRPATRAANRSNAGFALVASLTLMMLLGLIAVGVLAITSTQNRLASHAALQAEARQQALMGLDAALAEMQFALGPDQRVTASSGILSDNKSEPQHILGVWDSWQKALYNKSSGNIESTYTKGRANKFRRWLISSRYPDELSTLDSIKNLGTSKPGVRICLVGQGTLGHSADPSQYVYADMIEMPASGKNNACYAWWVSGENQKANVSLKEREKEATLNEIDILNRTWDTPPPDFSDSPTLSFLEVPEEAKDKMITLKSMLLSTGNTTHAGAAFFDVTPYSYTLPVNVRDGGLKHDLNLLLTKKSLNGTPFAARQNQDCPIADDASIPQGTEPNMPIGSWQVMHAYYHTWPDGSEKGGNSGWSKRLIGNVNNAYTEMSGYLSPGTIHTAAGEDEVTFFDTRIATDNDKAGYARVPVMLAFIGAHGLAVGPPSTGQSGRSHGFAYAPYVQWWNPYNVRMKVGAKKLWTYSLPYRTGGFLQWIENSWKRYIMYQPFSSSETGKNVDNTGGGQRNTFANDWGNYFVNSVTDQTSDIVFEPGEILVFSMSKAWNNLNLQNSSMMGQQDSVSFSQPQSVPFIMGDNGGELHNYFISIYSMGNWSGSTLGLSLESKHLYASATTPIASGKHVQTRIDEIDGAESNREHLFDTIGDVLGPRSRGMFAVMHGYDGVDASALAGQNLHDSRASSRVNRFYGAKGISPYHTNMSWYDYDIVQNDDDLRFCGQQEGYTWSLNMALNEPVYFTALGIIPKSYNPNPSDLLGMFREKDYRTKMWQHSNPAISSGALYKPDDQERQYCPFQLGALRMGSGLGRGSVDTIANRNGVFGTMSYGNGGGESVSFLSVLELPYHPPFSLAGFAGMRLTPGWYKSGASEFSTAEMRRLQYHAGVPGVGIGNAFADPCLPPDDIYAHNSSSKLNMLAVKAHKDVFSDAYDHALLINDALWDRWFCSSISDMPNPKGQKQEWRKVVDNFMDNDQPLPVSRYKKNMHGLNSKEAKAKILAEDGWLHIARYLWITGGFNVNSVSEEAWAATLRGLAKRDLLTNNGGHLKKIDKHESDVLFSRFMVSTAKHALNDGYNVLEGSSALRDGMKLTTAWGEVRALTPEDIRDLAREIVKKVRERGPFLNMSDFINRRLDGGSDTALTGALQAAIDATNINEMFKRRDFDVKVQTKGELYKFTKAAEGSMYTAAPGYLIQSDVLASLGNILTVRDDTFVVRAYGCVRSPRNAVLAQAWCEATVQRTIEYVDPSNKPEDTDSEEAAAYIKNNKRLSDINRVMGRKLRVISFKWLDKWDI